MEAPQSPEGEVLNTCLCGYIAASEAVVQFEDRDYFSFVCGVPQDVCVCHIRYTFQSTQLVMLCLRMGWLQTNGRKGRQHWKAYNARVWVTTFLSI